MQCVSQVRICLDSFASCHTEPEITDRIICLIQSQYTDTGPTSPCAHPRTLGQLKALEQVGCFRPRGRNLKRGLVVRYRAAVWVGWFVVVFCLFVCCCCWFFFVFVFCCFFLGGGGGGGV